VSEELEELAAKTHVREAVRGHSEVDEGIEHDDCDWQSVSVERKDIQSRAETCVHRLCLLFHVDNLMILDLLGLVDVLYDV